MRGTSWGDFPWVNLTLARDNLDGPSRLRASCIRPEKKRVLQDCHFTGVVQDPACVPLAAAIPGSRGCTSHFLSCCALAYPIEDLQGRSFLEHSSRLKKAILFAFYSNVRNIFWNVLI